MLLASPVIGSTAPYCRAGTHLTLILLNEGPKVIPVVTFTVSHYILLLVMMVNFLLCPIYKLNFTIGVVDKKRKKRYISRVWYSPQAQAPAGRMAVSVYRL